MDASTSLLRLPDERLVNILRFYLNDKRSLFSAARSHSRLRKAAARVLSSIKADVSSQQQLDSLLLYLSHHGLHVRTIITGNLLPEERPQLLLSYLPGTVPQQLQTLFVVDWKLQCGPNSRHAGVFGPCSYITKLVMYDCTLLDGSAGLESALAQLTDLKHLSFNYEVLPIHRRAAFPGSVLQNMQQLSHLELSGRALDESAVSLLDGPAAVQNIPLLTALQHLSLTLPVEQDITTGILRPLQSLTHLQLAWDASITWHNRPGQLEPAALASTSRQLQHLSLTGFSIRGLSCAAFLLALHPQQQLTHLRLDGQQDEHIQISGSCYTALTASSNLQHLDLHIQLPLSNLWNTLLPPVRKLPRLQEFSVHSLHRVAFHGFRGHLPPNRHAQRLVSACPALRQLRLLGAPHNPEMLSALRSLTGLHSLEAAAADSSVGSLLQRTSLRELTLAADLLSDAMHNDGRTCAVTDRGLLQLTLLTQLTKLVVPQVLLKWHVFEQQVRICQMGAGCGITQWAPSVGNQRHTECDTMYPCTGSKML